MSPLRGQGQLKDVGEVSMHECPFRALPDMDLKAAGPGLRSLEQPLFLPWALHGLFLCSVQRNKFHRGGLLRREVGQHPGGMWTCSCWLKGREGARRVAPAF